MVKAQWSAQVGTALTAFSEHIRPLTRPTSTALWNAGRYVSSIYACNSTKLKWLQGCQ
eukprot:COSAG01_NODE_4366_length_5093_cov_5.796155_2_plen_58_part_00